ncbi:MAG TPA: adenylate/guanylate cyclase domain-containing protein [Acidimicrobiales bacterium]|nr:adenylate/guanylate cyclase domain-containing protein [Acidimicrobiales bacterium]
MTCPHCGAEVALDARFCSSCGHELVVVGDQRRIATVLFADLVGFTALAETLDPEQVKALVDRCFARLADDIEAFGGRVDKVVGDGIVALFGAPVAHEDDAERAVRAGLRMQETIAGMAAEVGHGVQMRVGVNTGEVLVGAVRAGREYTAMGDVVNTASRLQEAAEPGTVLVGPETRLVTRDAFEWAEIDPVVAKGKRLPVEASVAVRAIAPPGQRLRRARAPMVGRDTEVALLDGVTATAIGRSRAALLVVYGEAGMGKSRLASETADHARCQLDALVLEGRCVPYGEANVWWPVAEAIRNAAGLTLESTPEETDRALREAATSALLDSGRLDELDRTVAGLHHLLGHDGTLRGIDAARAREEAIRSVVALAEGYTQKRPVFVVLSDLHWADQEVLNLVDTLLTRLARRPFVLLGTARRGLRDRWTPSPAAANSIVLHLDPLDDEASHRLLEHLTQGAMHPSMAAMLVERAAGNPFYLEELVSLVTEAGVRTMEGLLSSNEGELPSTLRGLVAARLDALSPGDRQILDDAAVLGRRNKIDALVTMASVKRGVDPEVSRAHLESLAAREFLVFDGDLYTFRSEVIREVAYSTLTKADRARSHAGIARWIEEHDDLDRAEHLVDQVANHWAAAAELVSEIGAVSHVPDDVRERAIGWLHRASLRAAADVHPSAVETLTTRALGLMDDRHPDRAELLRLRARSRVDRYELDAALEDLRQAEDLTRAHGDDRALGEVLLVRADAQHHRGAFVDALGTLAEAKDRFARAGHAAGCAESERLRGMVHLFGGDFAAADESLREALSLFEHVDDRRGVAWALQNLSWSAYMAGRIDEAEQRVTASMATFEEIGDPGGITWSRGLLAWVRFHQGRNEEALALATEVGEDARERGERWGEAMMCVLLSSISLWSGRTDDAVDAARHAVELFEQIDDHIGELQARCGLGRALLMSGDVAAGVAELEDATPREAEGEGDGVEQAWMARIATLASAVQLGDVDLGIRATAGAVGLGDGDTVGVGDRAAALALHHLQRGDLAAATQVLATAEPGGYVASARALVAAVAGDLEATLAAVEDLRRRPHTYLDEAYAGFGQALALVRAGRTLEARSVSTGVIADVDATSDRLSQAIARLVDAHVAERGERDDAATVRAVAESRLADLGVAADGWRHLLRDAVGVPSSDRRL